MEALHTRKSTMEMGEVYFYTSTIVAWKRLLTNDTYKKIIINSLKTLVERKCITIYGFVIMPNHIHLLWEILKKMVKKRLILVLVNLQPTNFNTLSVVSGGLVRTPATEMA